MAHEIRCDGGCGRTHPEECAPGWFEVSRVGLDVRTWGEEPGPWHFCSDECLHHWAGGRRNFFEETSRKG